MQSTHDDVKHTVVGFAVPKPLTDIFQRYPAVAELNIAIAVTFISDSQQSDITSPIFDVAKTSALVFIKTDRERLSMFAIRYGCL